MGSNYWGGGSRKKVKIIDFYFAKNGQNWSELVGFGGKSEFWEKKLRRPTRGAGCRPWDLAVFGVGDPVKSKKIKKVQKSEKKSEKEMKIFKKNHQKWSELVGTVGFGEKSEF